MLQVTPRFTSPKQVYMCACKFSVIRKNIAFLFEMGKGKPPSEKQKRKTENKLSNEKNKAISRSGNTRKQLSKIDKTRKDFKIKQARAHTAMRRHAPP